MINIVGNSDILDQIFIVIIKVMANSFTLTWPETAFSQTNVS